MEFSANLGLLWRELPLAQAIRAAHAHGFAAVECHCPYEEPVAEVVAALHDTGLPMLSLNASRGQQGENGLAALPGREDEARAAINQALGYAREIGAGAVHVMAGYSRGDAARETFLANLAHACTMAAADEIMVLIEPLNPRDAPGYFLNSTAQAASIISQVGAPNLKLIFDCYHIQQIEGDLTRRLSALLPLIGHIQIAGVPDRGPPDQGEVTYRYIFSQIRRLGYEHPLGAEYHPPKRTEDSLGWMRELTAPS